METNILFKTQVFAEILDGQAIIRDEWRLLFRDGQAIIHDGWRPIFSLKPKFLLKSVTA